MSHYKTYSTYKDSGVEWIGPVPEHWNVSPFFCLAKEICRSNQGMIESNILSLSYGRIIPKPKSENLGLVPESYETYQIVEPGEIVFRLTDLQNDKRSLRSAQVKERGIITSAYLTVKASSIDETYLAWLMRAYDYCKVFYTLGGGLRQSLKYSDIKRLSVIVPPLVEQCKSVRFIEQETARIDALIAKKTEFIELLTKKRKTLITHAVTKGLNPRAKMKDSGEEWLGSIPDHWKIVPSSRLFTESKERAHIDDDHLSATQKYGVIPLAEFERLEGRQVTHAIKNLEQRKHVEVDNFVISMRSFEGGIERVKVRGCIRSSYVALVAEKKAHIGFFSYLFKSSAYIQGLQATATFIRDGQDLSFSNFRQVKLPCPSIDEQRTIADFIERSISRIDILTEKTQLSIDLLRQRRSALITAAVTGKIDLRGLV